MRFVDHSVAFCTLSPSAAKSLAPRPLISTAGRKDACVHIERLSVAAKSTRRKTTPCRLVKHSVQGIKCQ